MLCGLSRGNYDLEGKIYQGLEDNERQWKGMDHGRHWEMEGRQLKGMEDIGKWRVGSGKKWKTLGNGG